MSDPAPPVASRMQVADALHPIDVEAARIGLRGIVGALRPGGRVLAPVQRETLHAIIRELWALDVDPSTVAPIEADELAARVTDPLRRRRLVELMVTLELLLHPLPPVVGDQVERYARALGVTVPEVREARLLAHDQAVLMYACIQRNSWYPAETRRDIRTGRLFEVIGSKLAYYGVARDPVLADRWRALGDLEPGTWGRGVFDFYRRHGFPFPGERHGIYEVGARHDWVHVLTDYGTTPEGEIDVFAFIAAAMPDPRGFVLLVVTLGIFQNGSVRHMFGRRVPLASTDALSGTGAPVRFADALRRGSECRVDPLNLDHFAYAARDLEEVRRAFNVRPPCP